MAKILKGDAVSNASLYEVYCEEQSINLIVCKLPFLNYWYKTSPTISNHNPTLFETATTIDMPLMQGCTYTFPNTIKRVYTLDKDFNKVRTFNMLNDKQGVYTPQTDEYILRLAYNIDTADSEIVSITGNVDKLIALQNNAKIYVNTIPGAQVHDGVSITQTSHELTELNDGWVWDFPIKPNTSYTFSPCLRTYTFDSNGNVVRNFSLSTDAENYTFTTQANEVRIMTTNTESAQKSRDFYISINGNADIDINLTHLELGSGSYTLKVKAKGEGKEDSDFSNEVTYTV